MPSQPAPGHPLRVVYAKLTSTGAYDVVARTSNISLDEARSLAERLLPGNPPLDAAVREEVAHLRPPEGGHIVWRFGRYGWSDGGRGDVYITDIAWYSDDDYALARADAFALVPRSDQVFATATELPPFTVAATTAAGERERLTSLHERLAADARTVIAGAAAADPVLLIHTGERAPALELFLLLLPPGLRAGLTFQTQAFRVPAVLPRITLADRAYANLREASWQVLPSLDVDVPLELAGRFVALATEPAVLELVHELYGDAYADQPSLRTAIARVVALADPAVPLLAGDAAAVMRAVTAADAAIRNAVLRQLQRTADEVTLRQALLALLPQPGESAERLLVVLNGLGEIPASTLAALVDGLPAGAPGGLLLELANRCARAGDEARLIRLLALDRRLAEQGLAGEGLDPEVQRLLASLRTGDTAELLLAAAALHPRLRSSAAAEPLGRMCHERVTDVLKHVQAGPRAVEEVLRLADAADAFVAAVGTSPALPPVMARYELARADAAAAAVTAHGNEARAVLGGAMLVRAWDAHTVDRSEDAASYSRAAVALLAAADRAAVERVKQVLPQRGVRESELVALPGADALLPLLGGDAQQAGLASRMVGAIRALGTGSEAAVAELAAAVLAAHSQRVRITAGSELEHGVLAALRARPEGNGQPAAPAAAMEVCLELLSIITDASQLAELEDAALGEHMAVRLQRLDRSVALCQSVEREDRYERYAAAIESVDVALPGAARERLREALGTGGLQRRLLRAVSSVIARDQP